MDQIFTDCNAALKYLCGKYQINECGLLERNKLKTASGKNINLLPWRSQRRFIELKNLIGNRTLEDVSTLRCCRVTAGGNLNDLLLREFDLCEWLSGSRVSSIFAVFSADCAANVIVKLRNGISCSIECSVMLPQGTTMIDRHEIIASRGVASDQVVDTQITQSSIYSYTQNKQNFTDVDAELFGLTPEQACVVRSACEYLKYPENFDDKYDYLTTVVAAAGESDHKKAPVIFEEARS